MKRENFYFYTLSGILFLFPVLFIFQGLDLTDMGYVLVSSRDMLVEPGNIYFHAHSTFLSMFLNGLWMKISAPWGLLGARAGTVLVYWCIFGMVFKTLKGRIPAVQLLAWLFLTFLFSHRPPSWISYNTMTMFFALSSLSVLFGGQVSDKKRLFCFSGGLAALAFFARLPNILMIGFGLIPILVPLMIPSEGLWKRSLARSGYFFAGYATVFLSVLLLMAVTGYLEYFRQGLLGIQKLATSTESIHSTKSLIKLFVKDHIRVLGMAIPLLILGGGSAFIVPRLPKFLRLLFLFLCGLCLFSVGWLFYLHTPIIQDGLVGTLYLYLLMRIWTAYYQKDANSLFLYLAALAILVTVPLGSGNGIGNARHAFWLALPLFLHDMAHLRNLAFPLGWPQLFEGDETRAAFWFKRLIIAAILLVGLASIYRYTYRDTSDRLAMRYSIDHPMLRGIYTTKERAAVVQDLLDELNPLVRPGDFLLGFHTVSTLYYVTETRPYLYSAWPFLYQPDQLQHFLAKAMRDRQQLPVAVRSKYSLQNFEWPGEKYTNSSPRYQKNLEIMRQFFKEKGYRKIWENKIFEIWLPSPVEAN